MNWVYTATIILHVLLATGIVALVLLQRGRGADAGAGFGSGASGTVFGARGSASFLSRSTAMLAGLFILTSLALAYLGTQRPTAPTSVTDKLVEPTTKPAPVPAITPVPAPGNSDAVVIPAPAAENPPTEPAGNQAPAPSDPAPSP